MEMVNTGETHNLRLFDLSMHLAHMASSPEQILHRTDDVSLYTTIPNSQYSILKPAIALEVGLEWDQKSPSFSSTHRIRPLLVV